MVVFSLELGRVMLDIEFPIPPVFVTLITAAVLACTAVGVPDSTPVVVFKLIPVGSDPD